MVWGGHSAYIEGFSRGNAVWRLDSEFRVKILWTSKESSFKFLADMDSESFVNLDSKFRIFRDSDSSLILLGTLGSPR